MKNFCKKNTIIFMIVIAIIGLFSNLITGFAQNAFAKDVTTSYLIEAVCKYSISIIPLIMMIKWGYTKKSNAKKMAMGFFLGSILILFCLQNILPLTLVNPILFKVQWGAVFAIALACFGIGLLEESAIRGVLLPMLCEKWQDKKNAYLKAALVSSLLFACIHLNWSVRYFLQNGTLTWEYLSGNLYQVYYTFCFGIFAAGIAMYAGSIIPIVFWHGICDISAFIMYGIIPSVTLQSYMKKNTLTLQNALNSFGILEGCSFNAELVNAIVNLVFLIVGVLLIKKSEKRLRTPAES